MLAFVAFGMMAMATEKQNVLGPDVNQARIPAASSPRPYGAGRSRGPAA